MRRIKRIIILLLIIEDLILNIVDVLLIFMILKKELFFIGLDLGQSLNCFYLKRLLKFNAVLITRL